MSESISSIQRPSLTLLATEPLRAVLEFASHKLARLYATAAGDGHRVVIFPGLASGSLAVAPLRDHCRALGYAACDWGRGYNVGPKGDVDQWLGDLARHVAALEPEPGQQLTLIGWSLGGLYAREVGKLLAPRVRQVITIGTPFNADADHTNVGWLYRALSGAPAALDVALSNRLRTPPPLPTTSIYSRSDGVVAWQTCCHARPLPPRVQDVEISGSHVGMGWNPQVLQVVADRLAQRPGQWRPYVPAATAGAAHATC